MDRTILLLLIAQVFAGHASGQPTIVRITSDMECRVSIDGQARGVLKPGETVRVDLGGGEHRMEATPLQGVGRWQDTIDATAGEQAVTIPLRTAVLRAEIEARGYWIDDTRRLMWAASDNGSGLTWSQAARHCRSLELAGYRDWALPDIETLHTLFGGPADARGYHLVTPLKITGWAWSRSPGSGPGEAWALDFGDGAKASAVMGDSGMNRALCVRRIETSH